jgi:hypothetical protein
MINKIPLSHEACDALWKYWNENGETHKHGYYESTWGAVQAYMNRSVETKNQRAEKPEIAMIEWKLKNLIEYTNSAHRELNGSWVPARPERGPFSWRVIAAWHVLTGKADAFTWPEGQ